MASVVLLIHDLGPRRTEVMAALYGMAPPSRILHCVGSEQPLLQRELFGREDPSFANRLLEMLRTLEDLKVKYAAFEVPASQAYCPGGAFYALTADRLANLIEEHHDSLQWIHYQTDLEGAE